MYRTLISILRIKFAPRVVELPKRLVSDVCIICGTHEIFNVTRNTTKILNGNILPSEYCSGKILFMKTVAKVIFQQLMLIHGMSPV